MTNPVNNQDTNDGLAPSDERSQSNREPQVASPIGRQTASANSPGAVATTKSTFDIVTRLLEIIAAFIVGVALVVVGFLQYTVYMRQAGIMEIEQRPWVSLESIEILSGLKFKTGVAEFSVGYELKNVGHSPSFNTMFYIVVTPSWFASEPGPISLHAPGPISVHGPESISGEDSMIVPNITDKTGTHSVLDIPKVNRIVCEQEFEIMRLNDII